MRPSLSRTLVLFALLVSVLPVFAAVLLLYGDGFETREIIADQFDRIAVKAARQMAEDSMRICRLSFGEQTRSFAAAADLMRNRFSELGPVDFSRRKYDAVVFPRNGKSAGKRARISSLKFGKSELDLNLSDGASVESSSGGIKETLDSLKLDTGLDFSLFVRMGERGGMLKVSSTCVDSSNREDVGAYIPMDDEGGGELARTLLAKKSYSGITRAADTDFFVVYEPLVSNTGDVVGAVAYGSPRNAVDPVLKYFENMRFGSNGYVWAVELAGKGESVYRVSRDGKLDGVAVENDTFKKRRDALLEIIDSAVSQGDAKVVTRQFRVSPAMRSGDDSVVAYFFFKPWNMVFCATVYRSDFFDEIASIEAFVQKSMYLLIPVAFIVLLFSAILARLAALRCVETAGVLIRGIRSMEAGKVSEARSGFREIIGSGGWCNREIYELGVSLDKMAEAVASLILGVKAGVANFADATEHISETSSEIGGMASYKRELLEGLVGGINYVSKSAELLNSDIACAADGISTALAAVNDGKNLASRLNENVLGLLGATDTVSAYLATIRDKTYRILSIASEVNAVNEKTNMLALNAAMEAERMGEIEGFEVVSKQMRILADRTSVGALHISNMAKVMKNSVESGVSELEFFASRMGENSAAMKSVLESISSVQEKIAQLGPKFEILARGVSVYTAGVPKIKSAADDLISATRQTRRITGNIADLTNLLKSASYSLEEKVARFGL